MHQREDDAVFLVLRTFDLDLAVAVIEAVPNSLTIGV